MYCKNCGAEYKDELAECPYCGAENYKKSVEEHQKVLDDYQQKTKQMHVSRQQVTQKEVKFVGIAIAVIILVVIVWAFLAGKMQAAESEREYKEKIKTQQELEELYQAGEYPELYQMWSDGRYNRYEDAYQKYWRVAELADGYESRLDLAEAEIELAISAAELGAEDGASNLNQIEYYIRFLCVCDWYATEDYPYGEEVGVLYYEDKVKTLLREKYLLTEEEIIQGMSDYAQTEEAPVYLYDISYERLTAQGE